MNIEDPFRSFEEAERDAQRVQEKLDTLHNPLLRVVYRGILGLKRARVAQAYEQVEAVSTGAIDC